MLAENYVEEAASEGMVCFGYETSMTASGADGGGMFILDPQTLAVQTRNTVAFQNTAAFVFVPVDGVADELPMSEDQVLSEGASSDAAPDERLRKQMLFDEVLLPQLSQAEGCNVLAVGDAIWELQNLGGKRVEVFKQPNGRKLFNFMKHVRDTLRDQVLIVGMSSIGPAIVVLSQSVQCKDPLLELASAAGLRLEIASSVCLTGARIRVLPPARFVPVVAPPYAGKSTLCQRLALLSDSLRHFGVGAFLRQFVTDPKQSAAEKEVIRDIMGKGEVADCGNLISKLVLHELYSHLVVAPQNSGTLTWLLDGFPRTPEQLLALVKEFNVSFPMAISLEVEGHQRLGRKRGNTPDRVCFNEPDLKRRSELDQSALLVKAFKLLGMPVKKVRNDDGILEVAVHSMLKALQD